TRFISVRPALPQDLHQDRLEIDPLSDCPGAQLFSHRTRNVERERELHVARHDRGLGASTNIVLGGLLGRASAATALRCLLRRRCRCREDEWLGAARGLGSGAARAHPTKCANSVTKPPKAVSATTRARASQ